MAVLGATALLVTTLSATGPALAASTVSPAVVASATAAPAPQGICTDLLVLTLRGSGEGFQESKVNTVRDAVLAGIGDKRSVTSEPIPYTAAAMSVLGQDFQDLIDIGMPLASDWKYFTSVNSGVELLNDRLLESQATCPAQKWILIGYSQGAMAITHTLPLFTDVTRFAGIVLVANPTRSSSDQQRNLGSATTGNGLNFWVPGDLGYSGLPQPLSGVTTDLCDALDAVCDTTHTFDGMLAPPAGSPWDAPLGVPGAIERGFQVHTAYSTDQLTAAAQPTIERALRFAVPEHRSTTILVCSPTGTVTGSVPVKPLSTPAVTVQKWSVARTLLGGALSSAAFTDRGFTKGSYSFSVDDTGAISGSLPAGRWDLTLGVTTGVDAGTTLAVRIHVITSGSCGAVSGYVTDRDGLPIEGVEAWLEKTTAGWDGVSDLRVAMSRTDAAGYYSISGAYAGAYVVRFTDGPAAQTYEEGTAEGYLDYFDQYYSTTPTNAYSGDTGSGTRIALGSTTVRADQMLLPSSGLVMEMVDRQKHEYVPGISASGSGWGATTGADGKLWHAGRFTYKGCMSIYDPQRVYVARGMYYLGWWGENIVGMYRGSSITGTVTDAAGKPLANTMVTFTRDELPDQPRYDFGGGAGCYNNKGLTESGQVFTDAKGRYRFSALYGGENYIVTAHVGTGSVRSKAFSLTNAYKGWDDVAVDLSADPRPLAAATPTISGTVKVGQKLTAKPGTWTAGTTFTYQWLRDGAAISTAKSSTYTVTASDAGRKISVKITGTKTGYTSASKTSASKAVPLQALTKTPTPTITGTAKAGSTLKAVMGTWAPSGTTVKYQWLRDGKAIPGATKSSYKLTAADVGKKISVKVTGSKVGYASITKTSKVTATVKR